MMEEFSGRLEPRTVPDLFDVEVTERVEAELNAFTEKRAREKADANKVEELWADQDRRDREWRHAAHRQAWIDHHGHMNRLHLGLAAEHADKRSRLMLEGGSYPSSPEAA